MRFGIYGATLIALAGTTGIALAAVPITLSSHQKTTLKQDLSQAKAQKAPASFVPDVGSKVPSSITLRMIPHRVATKISAVKGDRYAKLDNGDLLIVNHSNRKVAAMLSSSSTMGSSGTMGSSTN